jgi:hypothetical protein
VAAGRRAVRIEPEDLERGQEVGKLRLHSLGPRSDPGNRHRRALGARLGLRLGVPAVVAAQAAVPVEDQRHVAVGALPGVAAGAAGEMRGPPSPVDQEDGLAVGACDLREHLARTRMQRTGDAASHVDDLDRRQPASVHAARELQPFELVPAFGTGGGRAAEEHGAGLRRAPPRNLPRVVPRVALLLIGGIVLLIDHDQPGVRNRG